MTTDRLADPGLPKSPTGPEAAAQVEGIDPRTLRAGDVIQGGDDPHDCTTGR